MKSRGPMTRATQIKTPIMTPDEERFMAFDGLVQWTQAVVAQSARVSAARDYQVQMRSTPAQRRPAIHAFHAECHYFAVVAHKLLEFRDWVLTFIRGPRSLFRAGHTRSAQHARTRS
jgi:hypothetical protein